MTGAATARGTRLTERLWLGLALLFSALMLATRLDALPLTEPDEGRYADIARSFLATGDWVVPHMNGVSFHDKPPLVMWLTALSFRLFGLGAAAARIVPALSGLLGVVVAAACARALSGRTRAATFAVLFLATAPLWLGVSRTLVLDVPLAALVAAASALVLRGAGALGGKPSYPLKLAGGAVLGLAILTKGPVALALAGGGALVLALWEQDRALALRLLEPSPWVVALAVAAPWYVAFGQRDGVGLRAFLVEQNLRRFVASDEHLHHPAFYLQTLPWALGVATLYGLAVVWTRFRTPLRREAKALLAFVGFAVLFFSASRSKIETYILPVLPFTAALIAAGVDGSLGRPRARRAFRWITCGVAGLALAIPAVWLVLGAIGEASEKEELRLAATGTVEAALTSLLALPPALGAIGRARRRRVAPAIALLLVALGAVAQSAVRPFAAASTLRSAEPIARAILERRLPGQRLLVGDCYIRGLPFFLAEPVTSGLTTYEDLLPDFRRERPDLIAPLPEDLARLLLARRHSLVVMRRRSTGRGNPVGREFLEWLAHEHGDPIPPGELVGLGTYGAFELFELWPGRRRAEKP